MYFYFFLFFIQQMVTCKFNFIYIKKTKLLNYWFTFIFYGILRCSLYNFTYKWWHQWRTLKNIICIIVCWKMKSILYYDNESPLEIKQLFNASFQHQKHVIEKMHQKPLEKTKQMGLSQQSILNFNTDKEAGIFLFYQRVKWITNIQNLSNPKKIHVFTWNWKL